MKKIHKKVSSGCQDTINRIRSSATTLFASRGYRKTSIREIATYAKCNIAAVNYYFHGKERLYKEVFENQISDIIRLLEHSDVNEGDNHFNVLENNLRSAAKIFMS